MVKVSVVITTYNRAHYLPEAVNSVLAQTYQDFEVIVVDDGSTDNTHEVAQNFPACVRYVYQHNQGVSAALNKGIELARGEYITGLASDDVMLEDSLQRRVAFLDKHPEAGFCHGQVYTIDENGRPLRSNRVRGPKATFVRDGKEEIAHLLFRTAIESCTVMVRRSCLEEVGLFDTGLRLGEDCDMWIRLAKRYAVGHLAQPIAKYRVHAQSLTAHFEVESVKRIHIARLKSVFDDAELGPRYAHLRRKAYFGLYCYLGKVAAERGHRSLGVWYLLKGFWTCPELLFQGDGISLLVDTAKGFVPVRLKRRMMQVLRAMRLW